MEYTYKRSKKSDKLQKTFDKYGKHTAKGLRIKIEIINSTNILQK